MPGEAAVNQLLALTLVLTIGPVVMHAVWRDARTTALGACASLSLLGGAGLVLPWLGSRTLILVWLAALGLGVIFVVRRRASGATSPLGSERMLRLGLVLLPPIVLIGASEWFAWLVTEKGWVAL